VGFGAVECFRDFLWLGSSGFIYISMATLIVVFDLKLRAVEYYNATACHTR
jgi:hypothetical protein